MICRSICSLYYWDAFLAATLSTFCNPSGRILQRPAVLIWLIFSRPNQTFVYLCLLLTMLFSAARASVPCFAVFRDNNFWFIYFALFNLINYYLSWRKCSDRYFSSHGQIMHLSSHDREWAGIYTVVTGPHDYFEFELFIIFIFFTLKQYIMAASTDRSLSPSAASRGDQWPTARTWKVSTHAESNCDTVLTFLDILYNCTGSARERQSWAAEQFLYRVIGRQKCWERHSRACHQKWGDM